MYVLCDSGPLQGHLKIDVMDSVYATIHIGLFGFDVDIFRGELCFKGGIQYGLNILKVSVEETTQFTSVRTPLIGIDTWLLYTE